MKVWSWEQKRKILIVYLPKNNSYLCTVFQWLRGLHARVLSKDLCISWGAGSSLSPVERDLSSSVVLRLTNLTPGTSVL